MKSKFYLYKKLKNININLLAYLVLFILWHPYKTWRVISTGDAAASNHSSFTCKGNTRTKLCVNVGSLIEVVDTCIEFDHNALGCEMNGCKDDMQKLINRMGELKNMVLI